MYHSPWSRSGRSAPSAVAVDKLAAGIGGLIGPNQRFKILPAAGDVLYTATLDVVALTHTVRKVEDLTDADIARVKLLGIEVDMLTMDDLHSLISQAVVDDTRVIIANHNLHSVYLWHRDPVMRSFYDGADRVHVDGMALVLLGKLLALPLRREHRVTYVDWIRPLMREAVRKGFRVFYLGSRPGVAARGAAVLQAETPGLQIATHHGYFDPAAGGSENSSVVATIGTFRPDILIVGMGMPRQERWVLDNVGQLEAHAILTAGACMDFVAGVAPTPPRWMGRLGLEWLFRLLSEPSRLWRRYLVEPWFILHLFVRDLSRELKRRSGTDR